MNKQASENKFWLKWILNYSLGELLVIGIATTIGRLILVEFADFMSQSPWFVTPLFMILIGMIEGLTIGYLQWRSIRKLAGDLRLRSWLLATVASTTFGWILIFRPTIFLVAFFVDFGFDNKYYSFLYTLLAGATFGGIVGFAQYFILRRFYENAFAWAFSNVVGWMLSFLTIYLSISFIRSAHSLIYSVGVIVLACVCSGLVQGLTTGTSLHYFMSIRKNTPGFKEAH